MKKALLMISILALMLMGAKPSPADLIRLTLINKSGMEIAVQLRSIDTDFNKGDETFDSLQVYYLRVPEGDKESPATETFTIYRGSYDMQLHYIETYDSVYGFKCFQEAPTSLIAVRNLRVVFGKCGETPINWGEPGMRKYIPITYFARGERVGRVVTTQCAPLPVQLGLIRKCWQSRFIY